MENMTLPDFIMKQIEEKTAEYRQNLIAQATEKLMAFKLDAPIEVKKPAKKIVVKCPAPECNVPGVRSLMNFCVEHNRSIGMEAKKTLREAQKAAA